ncbi:signal recognition particle-docking protein FtsY [Thetidibacter halocola]|uniref:Signal recognition particle receptor FtsY n=1 Tax=Thetidibacter halocola TaxID=2827239 RepID=A0A8J8BBD4_9RHOB|nr:signal recognition particle-docking protein FtsY [Thetidibacter halocola]MBS0126108.1 signal recognition particle-docking protein FtsY [Thetidibacter halocola]
MSFFGKLKNRLFKSSSKLEEGLDAIVQDGGTEEPPERPEIAPPIDPVPTPPVETPSAPIETPEPPVEIPPAPEPEAPPPVQPPTPATPEAPPPADPRTTPTREVPPPPREAPRPAPMEMPEPAAPAEIPDTPYEGKVGFLGRMLGRKQAQPEIRRTLDDDMLEQLEELLIASDMGVDTALRVTANIAEGRFGKKLSVREIKELLAQEIARIMEPVARPLPLYPTKPQVVLVVGVNGSGKTTTIGKLASQFRAAGKKVVIAAGDTFRAAAVEQLQVWGERAGVPVMTAAQGSDPASLAFDAMTRAQAEGADLLMIDTAGRLQNRADLMEELAKIVRVIRKKDPNAPHNTLLVLDATTGQNALNQVEIFRKLADVSGLVMTKLDGTAKGGVLVALADKFGLPIHAIGVGEQIDDLAPFDPEEFAAALTGLDAG